MPVPMYRLETFGKLALAGAASAGVSHQRRRLALLALLASAGDDGLSRDQLLGYLWPDSSAANGRHSLEQLIHGIRRTLGDSVFKGVNPLSLNSEVVASDVAEFEDALERGSLAEAVALVDGTFLEGFYLEDAPEFERWTSTERSRLAQRYVDALNKLADAAEHAAHHSAALGWRKKLVEVDPVSSRYALAYMRALVASGDRTSALQHARVYETVVREELDSGPDPSIVGYAAALRAHTGYTGEKFPATIPQPQPQLQTASTAESITEPVSLRADIKPIEPPARKGARRAWIIGIALIAMAVVTGGLLLKQSPDLPALDENKIVIVPFRTSVTDSSVRYLGEGIADLIAPMLTGEGGPAAVDSRTAISTWNRVTRGRDGTADDARDVARELGADLVLSGAVVEVGGKLTMTGSVISISSRDTRQLTSVTGPADSVGPLLDRFVSQLLVRQSGLPETSISAITSQSLPAIRAYLDGRAAHRRADDAKAIESFTRAINIDSTFALAALDLAVATGKVLRSEICIDTTCRVFSIVPGLAANETDDDLFDRGVRLAWENRFKLGSRDRPLLEAIRGSSFPRESSARENLSNLQRALRAAPDRPETQYLLGTLLLYQGVALGKADSRGEAELAFRAASRLDSSYVAPLARMVDVAAFEGDTAKLRRAAAQFLSRQATGSTSDYVRWLVAVGTGDVAAQRAVRARFRTFDRATLEHIYLTSQMSGFGLEDADSASRIMVDIARTPLEKSVVLRRTNLLMLNRGRPSDANYFLDRMDQLRLSGAAARRFSISASLFNDGDRAAGDSSARVLERTVARDTLLPLSRDDVRRVSATVISISLWYVHRGDTIKAAAGSNWLRRHAEGQPRNHVLSILPEMMLASRSRKANGAKLRALVDSIAYDGCCQFPEFLNLVLARAYEDAGDDASALRAVRRGVWYYPPRILATYLREEGKLAARLGYRAEAVRAYEHFLALRTDPEPVFRPQRDSIRAEVDRLRKAR